MGEGQGKNVPTFDLTNALSSSYHPEPRTTLRGIDLGRIFSRVDRELLKSPGSCSLCNAGPPSSPKLVSLRQAWWEGLGHGAPRESVATYVPEHPRNQGAILASKNVEQTPGSLLCMEKLTDSASDNGDHSTNGGSSDDDGHNSAWFDEKSVKWFGASPWSEPDSIQKFLVASPEEEAISWKAVEAVPVVEGLACEGVDGEVKDVTKTLQKMGHVYGCISEAIMSAKSYMARLEKHAVNGPIRNEKGWTITKRQLLTLCLYLAAKVWQRDGIPMQTVLALMNNSGPNKWSIEDVRNAAMQIFQLLDYNILQDLLIDVNPAGVSIFCEAYVHIFPWT